MLEMRFIVMALRGIRVIHLTRKLILTQSDRSSTKHYPTSLDGCLVVTTPASVRNPLERRLYAVSTFIFFTIQSTSITSALHVGVIHEFNKRLCRTSYVSSQVLGAVIPVVGAGDHDPHLCLKPSGERKKLRDHGATV